MKSSLICLYSLLLATALLVTSSHASSNLPALSAEHSGLLFRLHGSNTVGAQMAPQLVRDYLIHKGLDNVAIHPTSKENEYRIAGYQTGSSKKIYVEIAAHGSSTGFRSLLSRQTDIAMSSRPIKDKEVTSLAELGPMRSFEAEKIIAIDGLAVIVHPSNPIYKLSIGDIRNIFSGEINNWQQLGGEDRSIQLYARDSNSGTWETFKKLVLGKKSELHPKAKRFESNDELSQHVLSDQGGIGFVGLASIGNTQALAVSDQNTRSLLPTRLSIATEDYPLARRLYFYVSPYNNSPLIEEFMSFAQGQTGQNRVQKVGYISQNPMGLPSLDLSSAPAAYTELIKDAQRLSVNIRFNSGSATLDNKAQQDILRLSQFMQQPENSDKDILLIGFGDSKQSEQRALILSKLRAIAVKSALRDQGLNTRPIAGLGSELPVANNQSNNKLKNQRVEVWLI